MTTACTYMYIAHYIHTPNINQAPEHRPNFVDVRACVHAGYSSLPRSCHSAGLDGAGMSDIGSGMPLSSPYCPDNTLPLLETVSEDQEIHTRRNNG